MKQWKDGLVIAELKSSCPLIERLICTFGISALSSYCFYHNMQQVIVKKKLIRSHKPVKQALWMTSNNYLMVCCLILFNFLKIEKNGQPIFFPEPGECKIK